MTRFATSLVMWEVTRDRDLAAQFRDDPASVLAGRDLAEDERQALHDVDLRALFDFGTHPSVLYFFALRLADGFSVAFIQDYVSQLQGLTLGNLET